MARFLRLCDLVIETTAGADVVGWTDGVAATGVPGGGGAPTAAMAGIRLAGRTAVVADAYARA
jgi:hypothetical protein